jgi:hydroxymethylglutaryl-CoA lyase
MMRRIEIVEVGPRDGLQNESAVVSVADRVEFIARLEAAGVRRVEAVSFVNPKRVPQMAGAEEVMAALPADPSRSRIGLALNLRGWERAVAAGCDEVNAVVSASEGFGLRNQGVPVADQIRTMQEIAENNAGLPLGPRLSLTISGGLRRPLRRRGSGSRSGRHRQGGGGRGLSGDRPGRHHRGGGPLDGSTSDRRLPGRRAPRPACACTSTTPAIRDWPTPLLRWKAGVDVLDSSCGGIGGCPFAPRATGNIATEDLVYMLERAGFETGLDLDRLIGTAEWLEGPLGKPAPSGLRRAGRFPSPPA